MREEPTLPSLQSDRSSGPTPPTQSAIKSDFFSPSLELILLLANFDTSGQRHRDSITPDTGEAQPHGFFCKTGNLFEFALSLPDSAANGAYSFPIIRSHQGAAGLGDLNWEGLSQQNAWSEQAGWRRWKGKLCMLTSAESMIEMR